MVAHPIDWDHTELGNLVDIYQGGTPSTTNPRFWDGDIVWLTPSEITKNVGLFIKDSERKITEEGLDNSNACLLPEGTILLCTRATIGDCAIASLPLATNQGFKSLVCHDGMHNIFLSYLLSLLKEEMISKATGTTFLEISKSELQKIKITIPSAEEQVAIADTLTQFDALIASLDELLDKKRNIREGAIKDFTHGHTRIDGFNDSWKVVSLSEITSSIITGGTPSTSNPANYGGNIPWLSSGEIHQRIINSPTTYITQHGLDNSSAKIAPAKSVLVALAGQGKTRGTAAMLIKPMALNQSLAALVPNENCDAGFLYYLLSGLYSELREISSGDGGRGGLNKKLLSSFAVNMPSSVSEQKAISDVLIKLDNEISALETERDKWQQIRDGAMDDLLTGRVRLQDWEV